MKAVVAAFNQEKALVGAFSVITNLRVELFEALISRYLAQLPSLLLLRARSLPRQQQLWCSEENFFHQRGFALIECNHTAMPLFSSAIGERKRINCKVSFQISFSPFPIPNIAYSRWKAKLRLRAGSRNATHI